MPKPIDITLGPEERGTIIGMTGCGKSHLAERVLPAEGRLLILDPKRLFKYRHDVKIYDDAARLLKEKPQRAVYRPKPDDLDKLNLYNDLLRYAYNLGNITIYTDDMVGIMDGKRYPPFMKVCYQMGRERKVRMLTTCQRPKEIPLFVLSEANKFYAFRLKLEDDRDRVREFVPGYPETFPEKYTFCFYDESEMERGQIIKLKDK